MKKLIAIFMIAVLSITLSACSENNVRPKDTSKPTVVLPDSYTATTVNGYKTESTDKETVTENKDETPKDNNSETVTVTKPEEDKTTNEVVSSFIANKSTKKFHKSSCSYGKNIKAENQLISDNRNELINGGYEPCKKCNP